MTFRSRISLNVALLLPIALAACQAPQIVRDRGEAAAPDRWRTPPPQTRAEPGRPAPAQDGAMPSSADLIADPGRFKGMSGADVTGILGAPSFQRHDGDAEIWQYYGPSSACVLDLFVYPDQGQPRIAHAELRSRSGGNANGCMAAILDGQRG